MKKVVIGIIIGLLISSVAYATVSLSSDKISYNDTTVKDSLDNLFNESASGKTSIVNSLSNNGLNLNNNSSYSDIVDGINNAFNDISNGKTKIATALTNNGVATANNATFEVIEQNINTLATNKYTEGRNAGIASFPTSYPFTINAGDGGNTYADYRIYTGGKKTLKITATQNRTDGDCGKAISYQKNGTGNYTSVMRHVPAAGASASVTVNIDVSNCTYVNIRVWTISSYVIASGSFVLS